MTFDDDTTSVVRSWLREGVTTLPDRVLDDVLGQLPANPQHRQWWRLAIPPRLSPAMAFGLVAAGVLLGVVVGVGLIPAATRFGDPEAPVPAPTPSPRVYHANSADLPPGTYVIDRPFPVRITLDIPDGWFSWGFSPKVAGILVDNGTPAGSGWGLVFWIVDRVPSDPCDASSPDVPLGPSVDDLVAALASLPGYAATTPVDITFAGHPGKELELTAPEYSVECRPHVTWRSDGFEPRAFEPGETNRLRILDVDGTRLVILTIEYAHTTEYEVATGIPFDPNDHADDQAELQAMVGSIRIEPASPVSETDGEAVIRAWIEAINAGEIEAAVALMAPRVANGVSGTVEGADALRALVERYECELEPETFERAGDAYLVRAILRDTPEGTCPTDIVDEPDTFVFEVRDGKLTRVP